VGIYASLWLTWAWKDKEMVTNTGEQVLDALLVLGYAVDIADDGKITATDGKKTLHGKAEQGTIEWSDRSSTYKVLQQAYIATLRKRIRESRHSPNQASSGQA
jgi:hypothetical protein